MTECNSFPLVESSLIPVLAMTDLIRKLQFAMAEVDLIELQLQRNDAVSSGRFALLRLHFQML